MAASPGYIRFFATTDDSTIGRAAHAYCRALNKIAPVRLISISGGLLAGGWRGLAALIGTPMDGGMIANAWCCDRSRWLWTQKAAIPRVGQSPEIVTQQVSLWTVNTRNIAFVLTPPKSKDEREILEKCDVVVVPALLQEALVGNGTTDNQVIDPESPDPEKMRMVVYGRQ